MIQGYYHRSDDNAKRMDQIEPFVSISTAQEVATELGVSAPIIKRNGQRGVEKKLDQIGPAFQKVKLTL